MRYAVQNGFIVFTNDLDFGALLALSRQAKPSVVQVRTKDVLPETIANIVLTLLHRFSSELNDGAIVTVDTAKPRVRILPLN
jgi:predicted nuclease of predicted toxin-antitoxin system